MACKDKNSIRIRAKRGGRIVSLNVPANTGSRELEEIRSKLKLGLLNPKETLKVIPTFRQHAEAWLARADCGYSTLKKAKQILRDYLNPQFGSKQIDEITAVDIIDYVAALRTKMAAQSVGNVISVMSNVLKDAVIRGLIPFNPTSGVKRIKKKRDVQQDEPILCWSLTERDRFLSYLQDNNYKAFQVAAFVLFTGLRPAEVRGLLGDCIDWNACTITVKRQWCSKQSKLVDYTKGRRNRIVPIPKTILDLLRDRPHGPTDQLFPETTNSYGFVTLRPLMQAAGVQVVKFHGLRHTFASQLYEVTKDVILVRDILGHTNVATTNTYLHRLTSKVSGSTDGLLAGASFLSRPSMVVPIRR